LTNYKTTGLKVLLNLSKLVLIISFLTIYIQTGDDTTVALWAFLYEPQPDYLPQILMSYNGIVLLALPLIKSISRKVIFTLTGVALLCVSLITFYPEYSQWQRENIVNPQYIFVFAVISTIVLGLIDNRVRQEMKELTFRSI